MNLRTKLRSLTIDRWIAGAFFIFLICAPLFLSMYKTLIFGKFISYMIFALALDILWGYAGLMNLGFAVFFGLGGYIMGISLASQDGLPDFMSFAGLTELPWFYAPLHSVGWAFMLGLAVPAAVALLLGVFIFKSKIKGVFYNLITLAFAALFELLIASKQMYTGGSSGVNGIARGLNNITFFGNEIGITGWYYIALVSLILIYAFCRWLTESRFGRVIKSIRDNEARLQFLGYSPAVFKMMIFALAGCIAGFAGMIYLPMTSFISVENAGVSFSTLALVWVAVGGRGNLTGAMVGAFIVNILQSEFSKALGTVWQLVLGVVIVLIVLFLPKGIIGTLKDKEYNWRIEKANREDKHGVS
jgi:urea transport system permease protein